MKLWRNNILKSNRSLTKWIFNKYIERLKWCTTHKLDRKKIDFFLDVLTIFSLVFGINFCRLFFGGTFLSLSFQFVYWFTVSKWNQENEKYTIFRVKINKCWFDFYHIAFAYPSNVFWYFRRTNQTMNAWKVSMRIRMKCLRRFPHLSFEPVHCKEHYSCARSMFLFFLGLMLHMGRECVFVCQQMACAVKHSSKLHTSYELSTEGSCMQM